jgi:hypothetical protein
MGKQLGFYKSDMPANDASDAEWVEYCKRDVDVLTQYQLSFMKFTHENDLCGLGLTLASQSFRAYRHKFMHHEIVLHSNEQVTKLERSGYSGGRVEAFYIGGLFYKTYYKVDVNSMYPYVMNDELYPTELIAHTDNVSLVKLPELLLSNYCIAECEIETQDNAYAYKSKHKLVFPIGNYSTVLHQRELEYALQHGHIKSIRQIAIYKRERIFTDFVKYFYALKQQAELENNPVLRFQAKIILNSLYGKFGQRQVVSKLFDNPNGFTIGRVAGYSETLGRNVTVTYLGNKMETRYMEGESTYSFPAIAGAVTAYARMYLYQLMQDAGLPNVFYCDTDSLIINQAGLDNLSGYLDNNKLGYLKVEDYTTQVSIRGCKDYSFGDETKTKGVPKKAVMLTTKSWEYEQFRGAKSWLNEGMPEGVIITQREKQRIGQYDKGNVSSSGTVSPLSLSWHGG